MSFGFPIKSHPIRKKIPKIYTGIPINCLLTEAIRVRPLWSAIFSLILYGRTLQMMYQPRSVGKMADFETLAHCISLNSSQMCTYFCKDYVTGCCLYLVKNSTPKCYPFSNRFQYPHLVVMGSMSLEICVFSNLMQLVDWYYMALTLRLMQRVMRRSGKDSVHLNEMRKMVTDLWS